MELDLARWQFAVTTVYHFLFVPVTIGLSAFVAGFHTAYLKNRNPQHLRMAKFLGKLFTINFALGLVTGIVQEFQFGMNWSDYSRFVGDIFGAPLAIEALLAFFLESTFLGLWIFGWGRIPEKLHVACIWIVHIGTLMSAYFILAANSFMQHPVGYRINPTTGRAELTDFVAVLTNKVQMVTFPHTAFAAYLTGAAVVLGASMWQLHRRKVEDDMPMYRTAARVGAIALIIAGAGVAISGDQQGKVMTEVQPMKMAAAEALYETQDSAPFSIVTISSLDGKQEKVAITVPKLLSFLGTGDFDGTIHGINDLERQYEAKYNADPLTRAATYTPTLPLTYWSFRLMIGLGMASVGVGLLSLWILRGGRTHARARWWPLLSVAVALGPVLGNAFGWIFTETGRQPWLIFGVFTTKSGVSPGVSAGEVLTSLIVFTTLYAVLAVIEIGLTIRYARAGAEPIKEQAATSEDDAPLQFAY
ncbi:cytochrome ubiquinol oxidase subunit I [Luteipulveratus mongoliensis]|uniref:Cytochrome BD ubiquinol oxidase subunit I n=1 Tax=Luteipulveratus mongoliensis TaxID=571913 RepID=A0A0K1JP90_9MICO|nr:cytochrome ubiquinol oxidase subunit I [Luteipulveratus mongoliensis]AKU18403.1 cytochrome BD ubiquinol oxidase subunit I [Luteipulveratus mongoliensis]